MAWMVVHFYMSLIIYMSLINDHLQIKMTDPLKMESTSNDYDYHDLNQLPVLFMYLFMASVPPEDNNPCLPLSVVEKKWIADICSSVRCHPQRCRDSVCEQFC